MIKLLPAEGQSFYLMDGEKNIGQVGYFMVSPVVMHVWTKLNEHIHERPLAFHKAILSLIRFAFETMTIHRMQFSVRCNFPKGFDWACALGFTPEGVMRDYEPDRSDAWLFARTK